MRPQGVRDAVRDRVGGVARTLQQSAADMPADRDRPSPTRSEGLSTNVARAVSLVDTAAASSAYACPRRFALQWAMGPSGAFQSEHHQTMLFGNVIGALVRTGRMTAGEAAQVSSDLWRHLTTGERLSSLERRVVKPEPPSAQPEWILTFEGRSGGSRPVDLAYRAAVVRNLPEPERLAPDDGNFLPPGPEDPTSCDFCPVRPRCAAWSRDNGD